MWINNARRRKLNQQTERFTQMRRLSILLFALCTATASAFAQNNIEPPLITVTGQAEVRVPPAEVLKAGITRLSNLQFMDSQIRKHRDEARRMAIRAAQEKARLLAGEIGQSIGPAYSITETSGSDYGRSNVAQNATSFIGSESS